MQRRDFISAAAAAALSPTLATSAFGQTAPGSFDALYPVGWTPRTDTAFAARAALPDISQMISRASPGFIDPVFGTAHFKIGSIPAVTADNVTYARHKYSRQAALNADNSRALITVSNGWTYVMNTLTGVREDMDRPLNAGAGGAINLGGEKREWSWHPTDPRLLLVSNSYGDLAQFYTYSLDTKSATLFWDALPAIRAAGGDWAQAYRVRTFEEGRPSRNGRYWAGIVERQADKSIIGFVRLDLQKKTVTGRLLCPNNMPDHLSISPSGNYVVISWPGFKNLTRDQCAAKPVSKTDGVRAYTADFSSFVQINCSGQHSDLGIDSLGRDVFVSATYSGGAGGRDAHITDGQCYYADLATGAITELPIRIYRGPGGSGSNSNQTAFHVSCTGPAGFALISTYGAPGVVDYGDDELLLQRLQPSAPTPARLGHMRAAVNEYSAEPQACLSSKAADGSVMAIWASNNVGTGQVEARMVGLPSWIFN
jgi:hypothetical protein